MSLVGARKSLADKLSTVTGITGHEYRPGVARPGAAWPLLESIAYDGQTTTARWTVVLMLPPDERKAAEFIDAHFADVMAALRVGDSYADAGDPAAFQTGGGDLYALEITVRSWY